MPAPLPIIDSHCHLDVPAFDADRDQVLEAAREVGVTEMVVPAVQAATWPSLLAFCDDKPDLHPALGLHPAYLANHQAGHVRDLERALERHCPVAIGEIGLDHAVPGLDHGRQADIFAAQLAVAADAGLPVILHVRKAHDAVLHMLECRKFGEGGIVHAFNGALEQGKRFLALGFKLGFGGMITFERSRKLRNLARALPLESIVLETDAPDLTVASHRGERNSPAYLPEVLASLAEVREEPLRRVAEVTRRNTHEVLRLPLARDRDPAASGPEARS